MKKRNSIESKIREKQEKVNKYISNYGIGNSDELLELSRELDILIITWLKSKRSLDKI
ncbi:MAG: Spo0E family sporulation regulatory protein-aspartic acid phosphatase [Bacillota bacterium]|nr:Spo0E family sporulation regulatory protein-aspartic acid phosphatase [Bacillota bacterium]